MKTIFALLIAVCAFTNLNAQSNDNSLIGRARAAAHDCLQPYAGYEITASVQSTNECGNTVTFAAGPRCTGNGPCPFFEILVATVEFDCDGNVISVTCN